MYNLSDADISGLHLMREFHPGRRLVFGATGYFGSHLVPRLLEEGLSVRACGRSLSALESRQWSGADLCIADALEPESLEDALADIEVAYYLVHSMAAGRNFGQLDLTAADETLSYQDMMNVLAEVSGKLSPRHSRLKPGRLWCRDGVKARSRSATSVGTMLTTLSRPVAVHSAGPLRRSCGA